MQLFAPKSQQFNLIFSGSPYRRLGQGRLDNHPERAMQWGLSCSLPPLQTLLPSPIQLPLKCFVPPLGRAGLRPAPQMALDRMAACQSWICSPCCNVMCLWYMCFCAEVFFFSVLRLYSKWSIVWGLKKIFPPLSPHVKAVFSKYPVSCSVYPVVICMLCMYGQVDG